MFDRFRLFRFRCRMKDYPNLPILRNALCLLEAPRLVILRKKRHETRKTSPASLRWVCENIPYSEHTPYLFYSAHANLGKKSRLHQ